MPSNTGNLLAFGENIVGGFSGEGGGSGGHTILDPNGTAMTQRPDMQFKGMKVSDNSTDGITEIDASPSSYTWDQWQAMTQQEREAIPNAIITGVPDADVDMMIPFMKVLWTNPSYSSAFASQVITLDSDDYDFLYVDVLYSKSNYRRIPSIIMPKGQSGHINIASSSANGVCDMWRNIVRSTDTSFSISDGAVKDMSASAVANNDILIPYRVYGFKADLTAQFRAIASDVSTDASKCMVDANTSVADALITKVPVIKAIESNDQSVMVAWLTTHNTEIPIGASIIDFRYATGICSKPATAVGRIRFTSYYSSLDNKSTYTADGTWSAIS